jgi:flagellar motor switch protein FliN
MDKHNPNDQENTQVENLEAFEEWDGGPEGVQEEVAPEPSMEVEELSEEAAPPAPGVPELPAEPIPTAAEEFADSLLELAPDVPVNLVAVIGKTSTNVGEIMKFKLGQVIELGRPPSETVDVVVSGRLIARGELVDVDGQLGVRILKMVR